MATDTKKIRAVERTLELVETIRDLEPVGVSDLARNVSVSKSTVHTHLATLTDAGYVIREDDEYRLSCTFLDIGSSVQERFELYRVGKRHVDELAHEADESSNLVIEEDGKGTCLYATNPRDSPDVYMSAGQQNHMHASATGKAILAHMPGPDVEALLERHGLPELTDQTISSRPALESELEGVRERGLAFDREETVNGLFCIAAPIVVDERAIGSISVSGPVSRLTAAPRKEQLCEAVEEIANVIELQFIFS
ncbi:IclR family transcriptional regulator [Halostagnicola kamekurae]|uniref:DNA-binding transcriptional regulator, IclR family n=1 Tax=Halostagnicola kamekurae TaxID=619731 RepID=A0A1I6U4M8_9EURY|nr:IclR family transcriptional regulator [Halostagnicola kamekurae]SFS96351.1 DNA-binding transcriptional regulator, IclR family [Halostagnicola kamekurae]